MCEDYPCCGHESGDCEGRRYGSDASIKAAARQRARRRAREYDGSDDDDYS